MILINYAMKWFWLNWPCSQCRAVNTMSMWWRSRSAQWKYGIYSGELHLRVPPRRK